MSAGVAFYWTGLFSFTRDKKKIFLSYLATTDQKKREKKSQSKQDTVLLQVLALQKLSALKQPNLLANQQMSCKTNYVNIWNLKGNNSS